MYRKFVWCYVFVLTLLDLSLNTKLTAQGKSHGVSIHDSLVEGITFQEWGAAAAGAGGEEGPGGAGAARLTPAALRFGHAPLGAAHAATVTLTNTANSTLHLASVAGTTPDFHASFFDSKTLAPDANTTFSVVYLGRREGPVSAHLYIHTSQGVHKYPVSAVGVASPWGVWPLVGLRVPLNATLDPLLTITNPTPHTVQVSEVYSSGSWLGLQLPEGQGGAARALWTVPAHEERPLVRLRLRLPPAPPPPPAASTSSTTPTQPHNHHALTAYIRIKTNASGAEGGWGGETLVVGVEARAAPPGEFALPLQLRLATRGSADPPHTMDISLGNSQAAAVRVAGGVWGARCDPRAPAAPPPDPRARPDLSTLHHNGNGNGGGKPAPACEGATVSILEPLLQPHLPPMKAAQLTLDYGKLWSSYESSRADGEAEAGGGGGEAGAGEAWCGGWVVAGRAAVPYSVRLLQGTLRAEPSQLHFITASRELALQQQELRVHNEFLVPLAILHLEVPPLLQQYVVVSAWRPLVVGAGQSVRAALVRLRDQPRLAELRLEAALVLHTNVTRYPVPLLAYSGRLHLEWQWPDSTDGWLRMGAVGTSSTRRVGALLRNPAPAPLCALGLRAALPGAHLALHACAAQALRAKPDHSCRCVPAGGSAQAWLTVVAPARAGPLAGLVRVATPHAASEYNVTLTAVAGRLAARPLRLHHAAPYAWSSAELVLESTMDLRMRVTDVRPQQADPALHYLPPEGAGAGAEVWAGARGVGSVRYAAERLCAPRCYTGLDLATEEGAAWVSRAGAGGSAGSLQADLALLLERRALFAALAPHARNISLHLHTTQVVQVAVQGAVQLAWPALAAGGAGWAGLAGVGGRAPLRIQLANPSRSHSLLLQPVLGPRLAMPNISSEEESLFCKNENCVYSADAFTLSEWRATAGEVREWGGAGAGAVGRGNGSALPVLLLAPGAELELRVTFAPKEPAALISYLYLRNNLTILESVQLTGRGAFPSFELAGRRPGSGEPLLLEVSSCAGVVRVSVAVRNTGRVPVRLREWRVAGRACEARGFRVQPCAPLALAPNESRALELAFAPDWSVARHAARLALRTDLGAAEFLLHAATPARLLPECARKAPRPPWEPALRAAGTLLALALLALVLAAAALDAERVLRRARAARAPALPRPPLDLRAVGARAAPPAPPPRAPAPAPPVVRRRKTRKVDPAAESRAFERWRAGLRLAEDESSRSSEDADAEEQTPPPSDRLVAPLLSPDAFEPARCDPPEYSPGEETTRDSGAAADREEDSLSTGSGSGSGSSSPLDHEHDDRDSTEERDDADENEDAAPRARPVDTDPPPPRPVRPAPLTPPADLQPRPARPRRDPDALRRPGDAPRPRAPTLKQHTRKDKPSKRRERAPPATPPRASPPRAAGPAPPGAGAGAGGGAGVPRWGAATWSAVVARGGSLAPGGAGAGADLRRRHEITAPPAHAPDRVPPRRLDDSLFYFNGDQSCTRPDRDFAWRPQTPAVAPAAPIELPTYVTPTRDYIEEPAAGGVFGSIGGGGNMGGGGGGVWGGPLASRAPGAWPWGSYGAGTLRPPPGFGSTPAANVGVVGSAVGTNVGTVGTNVGAVGPNVGAVGTGVVGGGARAFDPFHSLASIWTRTALDWRHDDRTADN